MFLTEHTEFIERSEMRNSSHSVPLSVVSVRAKFWLLVTTWCMLCSVQAQTPYYYLNRSFSSVQFDLQGIPTEYQLNEETDKLTDIVQGSITTNNCYAIEKQAAIPICYGSAVSAWNAALNYTGSTSNYNGKIFDNVGWVRGTKSANGEWGAYLWVLQNRIAFQASTSAWWTTNGISVAISNVMVGSLGDYQALSNVVDIGPVIPTNYPGVNKSDSGTYQVDITNVYYELSIPDIWIMPRDTAVAVGSSNVQFTVTGTNIPQGVNWSLMPDLSGSGGATIPSYDAWQAEIAPGNIATNYIVRATSKDNTNFYDQAMLYVLKIDIAQTETNVWIGITDVSLNLTPDSYLGNGTANWTSEPLGITGNGTNITFNPTTLTPTTYVVRAQSSLLATCFDTCTVTIIQVEFKEYASCSGFDPTINPPWIMVSEGGNNLSKADIDPTAAASQIRFESADTNVALVEPAQAASSPQTLTVSGVTNGIAGIKAFLVSNDCATLGVDVKTRLDKTIAIHAITEENDDVPVIPVGQGQPNQVCITAGTNGVLNSSTGGDDSTNANTIVTGPNGVCETEAGGDDVPVIDIDHGQPNAICVTKGVNDFRDTNPSGDDEINGDDIDTGDDGVCDTHANSTNLVPVNVPSASELQDYLNNEIWGKQANVYVTVARSDFTVNYDLNRDGILANATTGFGSEEEAVRTAAKDANKHVNVYYYNDGSINNAGTLNQECFIQDYHENSDVNITAHEVGHALGCQGESIYVLDVMYSNSLPANPGRVIKADWDAVNPFNP